MIVKIIRNLSRIYFNYEFITKNILKLVDNIQNLKFLPVADSFMPRWIDRLTSLLLNEKHVLSRDYIYINEYGYGGFSAIN